jgi:RNA polymerase sigma-70 factor (ECF subfamily)
MTIATSLHAERRTVAEARVRAAIEANYDALWRFVRRMGVPEAHAEDALQQVLLVFAQNIIAGLSAGTERSFLFGTALRIAADFRRKAHVSREIVDEELLLREPCSAPSAEAQLAQRELLRFVDGVLARLEPDLRVVFVLVEIEELTMAESSDALAIPAGTVASRLRRARELFEKHVQELKSHLEKGT